jgi:pimeloyl-ACP methyl ester carboxylesterase
VTAPVRSQGPEPGDPGELGEAGGLGAPDAHRVALPGGAMLHVARWSSPRADRWPCLLVHGFDNNARIWDPLARALRVLAPAYAVDLRGHGDSDWTDPSTYHPPQLLEDLEAVVQQLGLGRFDFVGHSLGAWLGVQYAARHPRAVARLVLAELPGLEQAALAKMRADHARRPVRFASAGDYRRYLAGIYTLGGDQALRHLAEHGLYETDGAYATKTDPAYLRASWDADPPRAWPGRPAVRWSLDELRRLGAGLTCPTLLMRGQYSAILKAQTAERLLASWAHATLVTVRGAGHALLVDNPRGCTRAIVDFLAAGAGGAVP